MKSKNSIETWIRTLLAFAMLLALLPHPAAAQEAEPELLPPCDVLIDVGHGGIDGGTSHEQLLEKNINLEIARELYAELNSRSITAVMSRNADYALSDDNTWLKIRSRHLRDLSQRKGLADLLQPKLVVSLHVNWSRGSVASGPIVLYNKRDDDSKKLAFDLQTTLNTLYGTESRTPIHGNTYFLLKHVKQPIVIAELGFISNSRDREWLVTKRRQKQIANTLADGIQTYLRNIERTDGEEEATLVDGLLYERVGKKSRIYYERKGLIISHGQRVDKRIALTFDDGPDPLETPQILNVLHKHGVKATFFVVGKQAEQHPELVMREAEEGHEIANHTYRHGVLSSGMSELEIQDEIRKTQQLLFALTGHMTRFFRPPMGHYNDTIVNATVKSGHKLVLWSLETEDWDAPPAGVIARRVGKQSREGDIVLFHDRVTGRSHTAEALDRILPDLIERGFEFVTLSQLLDF